MRLLKRLKVGLGRAYVMGGVLARMGWSGAKLHKLTTADGLRFPYIRLGTGRRGTVVWLHGFADHPAMFLPVADKLGDDYEVIAPAMPGFAGPHPAGARYSIESYTTWLTGFVAALDRPTVHLVGNSLGGATALGVALQAPERLTSLTLVDIAGVHRDDIRSVANDVVEGNNPFNIRSRADYDRFIARVYETPPRLPSIATEFLFDDMQSRADWYCKIMGDIQGGAVDPTQDHPDWLHHRMPQVRVPTQVVWGDKDSFFPLGLGEYTAATIPGAQLHVLRNTGHCPHAERPSELATLIDEFAQHVAQRSTADN